MGKVKDGSTASAPSKATKGGGSGGQSRGGGIAAFFGNLFQGGRYKPLQGRRARLGTTVALGVVLALGLYRLYDTLGETSKATQLAVPALLAVALGWLVYRLVEFPPFVEFLIATEAEMNKVSWTSRDELKRATAVVLITVTVMAFFLFGVDFLWQFLLKLIGVLRFGDTSDLGSNA